MRKVKISVMGSCTFFKLISFYTGIYDISTLYNLNYSKVIIIIIIQFTRSLLFSLVFTAKEQQHLFCFYFQD